MQPDLPRIIKRTLEFALLLSLVFCGHPRIIAQSYDNSAKNPGRSEPARPVTVADSITMTLVGNDLAEFLGTVPAEFSPDRRHFVVVTRRGNIENNTREYSLWLFRSHDVWQSSHPVRILQLASSSSRPAIDNVRWINSETVAFIGERPETLPQIYSLDVRTRKLSTLSSHHTAVLAFDSSSNLGTVAFLARPAVTRYLTPQALERGIIVSTQQLTELMMDHGSDPAGILHPFELFVGQRGGRTKQFNLRGDKPEPEAGVFLSPTGRYVIVKARASTFPDFWKEYKDPWNNAIRDIVMSRRGGWVPRDLLIDTQTGSVRPLLNTPLALNALGPEVAWSQDGKSVFVARTYLPLDTDDLSERALRESNTFVIELEIETGKITKIAEGNFDLLNLSPGGESIVLQPNSATGRRAGAPIEFRKTGDLWKIADTRTDVATSDRDFDVVEEEDMTTPPRLFAVDRKTHNKSLLMDLNPQFRNLKFGKVEEISWKGSDNHDARGGLYLPPNYVPGKKYPLVIQTHGWNRAKFWIDGISTAGYAAQALAGKGFVVAQVADEAEESSTKEGPTAMATFEGLVDFLDKRGLIDRNRVGLLGWSRTGFHVRYALTFSKYPFAAAVIADGMDSSYLQYMSWLNMSPTSGNEVERINGGAPFGDGLKSWVDKATGFNLERVKTPVRLLGLRPYSLLNNWEWFAGLQHLGRPVELIWLPDTEHSPVRPWERLTVQQGDVDWFSFWLQGYEDSDPAKAEQYKRWHESRKLQEKNETTRTGSKQ